MDGQEDKDKGDNELPDVLDWNKPDHRARYHLQPDANGTYEETSPGVFKKLGSGRKVHYRQVSDPTSSGSFVVEKMA